MGSCDPKAPPLPTYNLDLQAECKDLCKAPEHALPETMMPFHPRSNSVEKCLLHSQSFNQTYMYLQLYSLT